MPHLFKNILHVNCLQYGFVIYNDKVLIHKQDAVTPFPDSMILVDFC